MGPHKKTVAAHVNRAYLQAKKGRNRVNGVGSAPGYAHYIK